MLAEASFQRDARFDAALSELTDRGLEVREDALEAVQRGVEKRMSGAAELDVPLVVDSGHGPDWDTAH